MLASGDLSRRPASDQHPQFLQHLLLHPHHVCLNNFTTRPIATKGQNTIAAPLRAPRRTSINIAGLSALLALHEPPWLIMSRMSPSVNVPARVGAVVRDAGSRAPNAAQRTAPSN